FAETHGIKHTPANRFIKESTGVTREIYEDEYEIIYKEGVNYMKQIPGQGVTLWGARTLSKDPNWRYFTVRRVFSAISEAVRDGTRWAIFENYSIGLRNDLVSQINVFLWGLWNDGYLLGESADDAFYVLCNGELNPPENIKKGIVTLEVGLSIVRPTEFLVATISVQTAD
ncbi:MAG: phage tail sheath family protein, partial [Spirochaetaceae bacterium]|nr:phage tail sheath family protein [Spirochaetaceae bacterium]